ncbi:MAG: hypothetical protein KDA83_10780 [Planctomycetales bacterium]|nr:hypothetical protein [Planctomycetales bacterium]
MTGRKWIGWGALACALLASPWGVASLHAQVRLDVRGDRVVLTRGGEPYEVHGVGGQTDLAALAGLGGNSIRTWSTDGIDALLDEAHAHGLTVCVGFWLGHERHGFDYQNQTEVLRQLEQCLAVVERLKEHPAVLLWCVGNEMEGDGRNPAVWYAVDHIAREIKQIDPNHPTMTVIAELGENSEKLKAFERFCPHVDILGINSYAGIESLAQRYVEAGGTHPFIVTEHGPRGPWEVGRTRWGAPLESSSTEKAELYAAGYRQTVLNDSVNCLGSYAFLWGNKQETTATWFGMRLPDGTRLAATDAISESWTGRPPANRCPRIESLTVDRADLLKPGETITATLSASDPEQDSLQVEWVLRHDSVTIGVGGDAQADELAIAGAVDGDREKAEVTIPKGGGAYRLFAYVRDGNGGAAVANVPLFVDAPIMQVPSPKADLPFVVYGERESGAAADVYAPSGYMGNTEAITMTLDSEIEPRVGAHCLKVEYGAADQWGGVLWQSPANDWEGALPGGLDLSEATAVEFWVRGATGGETVSFMLGVVDGNFPYRDTAKAEAKDVRLTTEWRKVRIDLDGLDLSRIKTGFGWSMAGSGRPVTFYLDEIRYVAE